jgi:hypothetical protein
MSKFEAVENAVKDAKLVAFDGCHKIYVAMDSKSAKELKGGGYVVLKGDPRTMLKAVIKWYKESCGLRFVQGMSHNSYDPNLGFVNLIPQFERDDEDEDEDEDDEDELETLE